MIDAMSLLQQHLRSLQLALFSILSLLLLSALLAVLLPVSTKKNEQQPRQIQRDLSFLARAQPLFSFSAPLRSPAEWLELVFWDHRPPSGAEKRMVKLRLKESGEEVEVPLGQRIALEEREGLLHFGAGGFSITPEVCGELVSGRGIALRFEGEGISPWRWFPEESKKLGAEERWRGALCLGEDQLFQRYGGGQRKWVVQKAGSYFSVAVGEWVDETTYCAGVEGGKLQLLIWEEEGRAEKRVELTIRTPSSQKQKEWEALMANELPKEVKLRSHGCSAKLGKRRCFLQEGSWLVRSMKPEAPWLSPVWRQLLVASEIEESLKYQMPGPLMIIDRLRGEEGRISVKGDLFDETRTLVYSFTLALPLEKKPAIEAKSSPAVPAAPPSQERKKRGNE